MAGRDGHTRGQRLLGGAIGARRNGTQASGRGGGKGEGTVRASERTAEATCGYASRSRSAFGKIARKYPQRVVMGQRKQRQSWSSLGTARSTRTHCRALSFQRDKREWLPRASDGIVLKSPRVNEADACCVSPCFAVCDCSALSFARVPDCCSVHTAVPTRLRPLCACSSARSTHEETCRARLDCLGAE